MKNVLSEIEQTDQLLAIQQRSRKMTHAISNNEWKGFRRSLRLPIDELMEIKYMVLSSIDNEIS